MFDFGFAFAFVILSAAFVILNAVKDLKAPLPLAKSGCKVEKILHCGQDDKKAPDFGQPPFLPHRVNPKLLLVLALLFTPKRTK